MKQALLFILLLSFFPIISQAQMYQVGHKSQTFVDASRSNRNITAEIYYPATSAGDNVAIASGQFPILVFGHGFVMTWSAYSPVWNALVPSGYIMVFPTTETGFSPSHTNLGKDIAYLVGAMKAESLNNASTFFGAVGTTSAVLGHSMGAGSAFLAVQYDASITAIATFAAANTNPSSIAAAVGISIPSLVIAAANDCVAPPSEHQLPMYTALSSSCKTYLSITGGSHCQFAGSNTNCTLGEITCSPQPTINRETQQVLSYNPLLLWLNFYLKNDNASGSQFQNLVTAGSGITSLQNCSLLSTVEAVQPIVVVAPNPFSSSTTIQTNAPLNNGTLTMSNLYGQAVFKKNNINGNSIILSRENLSSGIYIVQITEGTTIVATNKIVITD